MEQKRVYRYKTSRKTYLLTLLYIALLAGGGLLIYKLYEGGYFSAWFISVVVALLALVTLSIPRKIILDSEKLSIICILEITEISTSEIISVRAIPKEESSLIIPLIGSFGVFGYFGYYLDLITFERVRLYATSREEMIEIIDIYDDRHIISCRDTEAFIEQLEGYIERYHPDLFEEVSDNSDNSDSSETCEESDILKLWREAVKSST